MTSPLKWRSKQVSKRLSAISCQLSASVLAVLLAGCSIGTTFKRSQTEPTYAYRGEGEYRPDRDADVLARGKEATTAAVTFLEQEAPPAGAQVLGRVAYSTGKLVGKDELVARVKAVAAAAGGDAAAGTFVFADRDGQRAEGVEAVILKLAP